MTMGTLAFEVPKEMESFVEANGCRSELLRNALILLPYIQDLTISHGRAAELLGISKETLINLYGDMGIPYLDGSIQSVHEEMAVYSAAMGMFPNRASSISRL